MGKEGSSPGQCSQRHAVAPSPLCLDLQLPLVASPLLGSQTRGPPGYTEARDVSESSDSCPLLFPYLRVLGGLT